MSANYTPTTDEVRRLYKSGAWLMSDRVSNPHRPDEYEPELFEEFDRWLEEERRNWLK